MGEPDSIARSTASFTIVLRVSGDASGMRSSRGCRDPFRVCIVGSGTRFLSGISYYTHRLACALAEHHDVSVILMRRLMPARLYPGRRRVGTELADLRFPSAVDVFDGVDWYGGRTLPAAVRFLRRHRADVLVLEWWTATVLHSYIAIALAAKLQRTKVVLEYHELQDPGEAALPWARAL